jgi:hypothetical protein
VILAESGSLICGAAKWYTLLGKGMRGKDRVDAFALPAFLDAGRLETCGRRFAQN